MGISDRVGVLMEAIAKKKGAPAESIVTVEAESRTFKTAF